VAQFLTIESLAKLGIHLLEDYQVFIVYSQLQGQLLTLAPPLFDVEFLVGRRWGLNGDGIN
jgi:hypothetical protein